MPRQRESGPFAVWVLAPDPYLKPPLNRTVDTFAKGCRPHSDAAREGIFRSNPLLYRKTQPRTVAKTMRRSNHAFEVAKEPRMRTFRDNAHGEDRGYIVSFFCAKDL